MSKLTRRNLIAVAAAAPLLAATRSGTSTLDPVSGLARTWIAERKRADALMARWGDLEHELPPGMLGKRGRHLLQQKAMRVIDRELKQLFAKLNRDAERITRMQARSRAGALAKIEMALAILEPVDVEEHSWGLVNSGFADLTRLGEGR
jgi:hypothetical protein